MLGSEWPSIVDAWRIAASLWGFTIMFWATALWWIPMLVILGAWRHVYSRFPLRYEPLYWGAVFPLRMYTVATVRLAQAIEVWIRAVIPRLFVYIGLAAWATTLVGLIRQRVRDITSSRSARSHVRIL
jgi:tellurite resistance protein TehA-like permease